jgi:hypothetical protein
MKLRIKITLMVFSFVSQITYCQLRNPRLITNDEFYAIMQSENLTEEVFEFNSKTVRKKFAYLLNTRKEEWLEKRQAFIRSIYYHAFHDQLPNVQTNAELLSLYEKYPTSKVEFVPVDMTYKELKQQLTIGKIRLYQVKPDHYMFVSNRFENLNDVPEGSKPIAVKDFKKTIE